MPSYTSYIENDINENVKPVEYKLKIQNEIVNIVVKAVGYYINKLTTESYNHFTTLQGNTLHFQNYIMKILKASPTFNELSHIDFEVTTQNIKVKSNVEKMSPSGERYKDYIYIEINNVRDIILNEIKSRHPHAFNLDNDDAPTYR
jgi:hypothetical protein